MTPLGQECAGGRLRALPHRPCCLLGWPGARPWSLVPRKAVWAHRGGPGPALHDRAVTLGWPGTCCAPGTVQRARAGRVLCGGACPQRQAHWPLGESEAPTRPAEPPGLLGCGVWRAHCASVGHQGLRPLSPRSEITGALEETWGLGWREWVSVLSLPDHLARAWQSPALGLTKAVVTWSPL